MLLNFEREISDSGVWDEADAEINENDTVKLRWITVDAPGGCTGSSSSTDDIFEDNVSGERGTTTITEPVPGASNTYQVACSNNNNISAYESIKIKTKRSPPTAILEISTDDGVNWRAPKDKDITIRFEDEIRLRWTSANASECIGIGFDTDNKTNGTTTAITPDSNVTYSLKCF